MKRKNVMILGKTPPPYMGPAVATLILLKSKLAETFNLIHLNTKINDDLRDIGRFSFSKLKKNIALYTSMYSKIKIEKPDVILIPISQSTIGFLKDSIYIWIGILCRKKIVLHLRGSDFKRWFDTRSSLMQLFVKKTLSKTKGVIVLGHNLKALFKGLYNDEDIYVCPNGGTYQFKEKETRNNNKFKLLYIGNLLPSKGIEDVLLALSLLPKADLENIELTVKGEWLVPETKMNSMKIVEEHALPVTFLPAIHPLSKFDLLANADLFLFPPRDPEGHPWVIIEAMAASLPIISTDQGAIIESVIDGYNGYVVPSKSPTAIAEKIKLLLTNDELRKSMSDASYSHYTKEFTEERMIEKLTEILYSVINK